MVNPVNVDFQEELKAQQNPDKVNTLKAPQNVQDDINVETTISKEELFGKNVIEGQLPTLTQSFIIQKSKEDKLNELGQIAQEMYESKKVSRSQVVSIESIARELIPATEEEVASGERKVIVSDHEVNMYTEEPTITEAETTVVNVQANVDRIVSELRDSAICLAEQVIDVAISDNSKRKERILKGVEVFNEAICKFLIETKSDTLEGANIRFKRDLAWGNLMAIPMWAIMNKKGEELEDMIKTFDGTSGETFVKELSELTGSGVFVYTLLSNFVAKNYAIVKDSRIIQNEQDKNISVAFTIGDLFTAFGSNNMQSFYLFFEEEVSTQIAAAKAAKELLAGETDIKKIVNLSNELQNQHKCLMFIASNISVLSAVQCLVINFLNTF